jgi:hypothetical protein
MENDASGRPDDVIVLVDINAWFAERGFRIVPSAADYSGQVRSSLWGKRAKSQDHHVWVDLTRPDGAIVSPGYGSGSTLSDAAKSAQRRWQAEQEGSTGTGPRILP